MRYSNMKRLLLPLILVILITGIIFVSCGKEDAAPTTEPETTGEEVTTETTTTTAKKEFPTFKTVPAGSTTEFKGTPVIYPTTSTTTKATTTTTTKATTTTTTKAPTTTTAPEKPGDQEYDKADEEVGPFEPLSNVENNNGNVTEIINLLTKTLG